MKKISLIGSCFITVLYSISVLSQQIEFENVYGTPDDDEMSAMIEDYDGNIIICGETGDAWGLANKKAFLMKIGTNGDSLNFKTFWQPDDTISRFVTILLLQDSSYLITGFKGANYTKLWLLNINQDFEIISQKSYPTVQGYNFDDVRTIQKADGNFIAGGIIETINSNICRYFFYDFNQNCDTIKSKYSDDLEHRAMLGDIQIVHQSESILLLVENYNTNASSEILKFDKYFNLDTMINLPLWSQIVYTATWIQEDKLMISEMFYHVNSQQDEDVGLHIMDTNGVYSATYLMGEYEIVDYLAFTKGIDFLRKDIIFVAGTNRQSFSFFPYTSSYVMLGVVDSTLNMRWYQKYGGDAYYQLYSIIATHDGGCVMTGDRFDYQTQYEEHDIFVMKIFPPDSLLIKDKTLSILNSGVTISPNPANDYIQIKTNSSSIEGFEIFSISGTKVFETDILNNNNKINIKYLNSGLYFFKAIDDRSITYTGKFVKL